jgi:DNA-binding MarR family transcriptional regulator
MDERSGAPPVAPLTEREMTAFHLLLRAHARIVRQLETDLVAEHDLSLPAYEVLAHLSEAPTGQLRMSELTEYAVLSPSGLTRLVDRLSRDGLVCRGRDPSDARVVLARITDEGMERLKAAYPTHLRGVREHYLSRLSADELDQVVCGLGPIVTGAPLPECET